MRLSDYFPESSISVIHSAKIGRKLSISRWYHCWIKTISARITFRQLKIPPLTMALIIFSHQGVAMPHARPECGALKTGMSLTLLEQGVYFPGNDEPIKLLIGLSAADADSHIGAIQALSELLCEEEILEQLLTASSEKQLADIISRG